MPGFGLHCAVASRASRGGTLNNRKQVHRICFQIRITSLIFIDKLYNNSDSINQH